MNQRNQGNQEYILNTQLSHVKSHVTEIDYREYFESDIPGESNGVWFDNKVQDLISKGSDEFQIAAIASPLTCHWRARETGRDL